MKLSQVWLIAIACLTGATAAQQKQQAAAAESTPIELTIDSQWDHAANHYQVSLMAMGPRVFDHKEARVDIKTTGVDTVSAAVPVLDAPFKGFQISITKRGSAYRHFCNGPGLKLGKVAKQPTKVYITLTEPKGQFTTKDGRIRNDAYPECQAVVG